MHCIYPSEYVITYNGVRRLDARSDSSRSDSSMQIDAFLPLNLVWQGGKALRGTCGHIPNVRTKGFDVVDRWGLRV